jgi:predicted AAA+ superfamily ATPase
MENAVLKTLLYYNPWIENPKGWSQAVQAHLPQAEGHPYIKGFADNNPNWPQQHKVNLVVGPWQAGKSTLIWHTLSSLGPKISFLKPISRN